MTEKEKLSLKIRLGKRLSYDKSRVMEIVKEEIDKTETTIERPHGEWIPVKFRPMTEEEVTEYEDKWGWHIAEDERVMFDCPLPVDGQQILISTKYGVSVDYCTYDSEYGYGLEDRDDWDGVNAWMPLPTQYQKEGDEK